MLVLPKLKTPVGIQLDLNDLSNPQQFTSLSGTTYLQINAGTVSLPVASVTGQVVVTGPDTQVTFPNVTSLDNVTTISVGGTNSSLSFPAVTAYTQPVDRKVDWTVGIDYQDNTGSHLDFPALATITGTVPDATFTNGQFTITAQHGTHLNLPALTTISV